MEGVACRRTVVRGTFVGRNGEELRDPGTVRRRRQVDGRGDSSRSVSTAGAWEETDALRARVREPERERVHPGSDEETTQTWRGSLEKRTGVEVCVHVDGPRLGTRRWGEGLTDGPRRWESPSHR